MKSITAEYDLVVCGGGMAGLCAALAAARNGCRTALIHDRPVLGGNASSEVRVTVHGTGCHHHYGRETGIISELLVEERVRNHEIINENGWTNSVYDLVMYDACQQEELLDLHLNTTVVDVAFADGSRAGDAVASRPPATTTAGYAHRPACAQSNRIAAVIARVANAETELELRAGQVLDATGDALVADLAGCEWRMGSEGREETGEPHAPEQPSTDTMGNSIHIRCRDMGRDVPFTPPDWAVVHDDPAYFYEQGRLPNVPEGGFWWIEIGVPWHTIYDNETIRHELTRHALGIWDWMKNRDPEMKERTRTFALDWIGQVPGKRESRRIRGRYWLQEQDIQERVAFADEVAYGGWFVDLHTPGGLLAPTSEPVSAEGYRPDSEYAAMSHVGPYGLPLGMLLAQDLENLWLAGRDVSATHAALGSVRVMATCALMGQAVGTAAAIARSRGVYPAAVLADPTEVQQRLLRAGCFLPNIANNDPADLARSARVAVSSHQRAGGAGPDDRFAWGGIRHQPASGATQQIDRVVGQIIPVDGGPLDSLAMCIDNSTDVSVEVPVRLCLIDSIWDYRLNPEEILAEGLVTVEPGLGQWATWPVALATTGDVGLLRLEVGPGEGLAWRLSTGFVPGAVSMFAISPSRMRPVHQGATLAHSVTPGQKVFTGQEVLTGVTRPAARLNRWRSDPGCPLPQTLDLTWDSPQSLAEVELNFGGHMLREIHACPPGWRDPQIPRDYRLLVDDDGSWNEVARVEGNYAQRRQHVLERPVSTTALRVMVTATNGDPSVNLSEVRCYGPASA
jgi:hypothetical protein